MKTEIWDNPEATYRETLAPAMEITDQLEADEYMARLMHRDITLFGLHPKKAYENAMINLGYYAGYYGCEVGVRVKELFGAVHPIFGG